MSMHTKILSSLLILLSGILPLNRQLASAADSVALYTPYTKITVSPGEPVVFSISVINNSSEIQNVDLLVSGIPREWNYLLTSATYKINQISVLPGEKNQFALTVEVPAKVNKGTYRFRVRAGEYDTLPLAIVVSEEGTYKTEFSTSQEYMEGQAKAGFSFRTDLKNLTDETQLYSLRSQSLPGWNVTFKPNNQQATSVELEPNGSIVVLIQIDPPDFTEAGSYSIPVSAVTASTSATLVLETVVTGTYEMELTTPSGLLSTDITAGDDKQIELLVKNTGSSELNDITFTYSAPANWSIIFDPRSVGRLEAGKSTSVIATINADKKAIAGDYAANIVARTPFVASSALFRIAVKTPMLLGWIGILIIVAALGGVYYLFRKYGRR